MDDKLSGSLSYEPAIESIQTWTPVATTASLKAFSSLCREHPGELALNYGIYCTLDGGCFWSVERSATRSQLASIFRHHLEVYFADFIGFSVQRPALEVFLIMCLWRGVPYFGGCFIICGGRSPWEQPIHCFVPYLEAVPNLWEDCSRALLYIGG